MSNDGTVASLSTISQRHRYPLATLRKYLYLCITEKKPASAWFGEDLTSTG
jgi:hypothetical protein